jgi:DNA-binding response OmpR family regulator
MTVANVSGTIQQALELGANETINKPFEMQELMEKIEKVLW